VRRRRPYLLPGQQPATVTADRLGAQRRQVGPGSGLGKQLTPKEFATQCGRHEALDLFRRAVLEDRRRRPPAHHQVGPLDTGRHQLLVDQQLFGRCRTAPVRRRPMRRLQPRLGQGHLPLLAGQRGDLGDRCGDLGSPALDVREVDTQTTAHPVLSEHGDAAQPALGTT
jgi:hypothetical protein